ncbi:thiol-disulfide isomerase/thioredoxin [Kribbella amoyensis]|uniref:Thiol-disulfide isomerase/thioredoxin n=1 Tax=Kribbella amoyensis TaxID=996641 RepID=A0A561BQ70_9ACTN|nr:TlpA disulfide reductase family protein [Kribbella amoyensis]TWD81028.1 thiol-disulfide isomerase/thioredoxin [Kribbella amoyensis]
MRFRSRTPLAVVAAALLLLAVGCGEDKAGSTPEATGTAAKLVPCPVTESKPPVSNGLPDISLPCLGDGPDVRLADLRGPLLINVWAQWCGPCREEAPYLAELRKKAAGKVQLFGVDYLDPRRELAVKFAAEEGLEYPHLVDSEKQLQRPLRIGGPPLTAFVDAKGAVVYVHRSVFTSQQQLDDLVREKLGVSW